MVTDLHKAAQQALEALQSCTPGDYSTGHVIHPSFDDDAIDAAITALREALAKPAVLEWIAVSEKMPEPGVPVLACYTNRLGNTRRIRSFWTPANTMESDGDSDIGVYDEATDTYYDPAGWYECMDNWDEYSAIFVNEGEVTHWMPLPAASQPKDKP